MASSEEDDDSSYPPTDDPIAARGHAFSDLLVTLRDIQDSELKREGMLMLSAIRLSIKSRVKAQLEVIQGGKSGGEV